MIYQRGNIINQHSILFYLLLEITRCLQAGACCSPPTSRHVGVGSLSSPRSSGADRSGFVLWEFSKIEFAKLTLVYKAGDWRRSKSPRDIVQKADCREGSHAGTIYRTASWILKLESALVGALEARISTPKVNPNKFANEWQWESNSLLWLAMNWSGLKHL